MKNKRQNKFIEKSRDSERERERQRQRQTGPRASGMSTSQFSLCKLYNNLFILF